MARSFISRKTLIEFREYMTGWVLREIQAEFSAAGIAASKITTVDVKSGARRLEVELHYASIDLTKEQDAARLVTVFENVISNAERAYPERARDLVAWIETLLGSKSYQTGDSACRGRGNAGGG